MTGLELSAAFVAHPNFEQLRRGLPDIGDSLSAQFQALHDHANTGDAEVLVANLAGAQRAILRLLEAMHREGCGDGI